MSTELQDNNGDNEKLSWPEYKRLSDMWAKELSNRTELSQGLTNTDIDEKQAYFFTLYELKQDELFQEIDLFENYAFMHDELKDLYEKWEDKIDNGISYDGCEKFQSECEAIGYTFDYYLDANPIYLRPIDPDDQYLLRDFINQNQNQNMENTEKNEKELLIQALNAFYQNEENPEPMWDFNHSAGQKILDFCIETQNKEEVFEAVLNYYTVIVDPIVEPDVRDYDLEVLGDEELYNKHIASYNIESADFEIAYNNAINELNRLGISEIDLPIDGNREIEAIRTLKKDLDTQFAHLVPAVYNDIFEQKNKSVVLEIGKLAIVNHEADYFKGQIVNINDDRIVLKNLAGLEKNFHKDEIYQFFPGQKYDISEIEFLFKVKPAGINFSDLDKSDLTRLMRGELTNTVFKGVSEKEGQKSEYLFKMRPEYSSKENKLTLKPYWKNKQDIMPTMAFGTVLNENQIKEAKEGKAIIVEGISKEEKPFTVKVHYDKDLNTFIADKFINKNDLVNKETAKSVQNTYKIDGRIDFTKNDDVIQNKGPKI